MRQRLFKKRILAIIFLLFVLVTIDSIRQYHGSGLPRLPISVSEIRAGSGDNVSGWAWSENIGWISFNCSNLGCPGADYGVNVDSATGLFSGYAWSENIGMISFADFDADGDIDGDDINIAGSPCAPNCQARLVGNQVNGWARALSAVNEPEAGAWDGWIKLRGVADDGSVYGVSYNAGTKEFEGWAWGGDDNSDQAVIGWISFNCNNTSICPVSDYKVTLNMPLAPTAQANCKCPLTSPPGDCNAPACTAFSQNHIRIGGMLVNAEGSSDIPDCPAGYPNLPCALICGWSSASWTSTGCGDNLFSPSGFGLFGIALTVTDTEAMIDADNVTVDLRPDTWANFQCCYGSAKDNLSDCALEDWQSCADIAPEIGKDKIWLRADLLSRPSDGANLDETSYSWNFPAGVTPPADSEGAQVGWFYMLINQVSISLNITDSNGRNDTVIVSISATFPSPHWHED